MVETDEMVFTIAQSFLRPLTQRCVWHQEPIYGSMHVCKVLMNDLNGLFLIGPNTKVCHVPVWSQRASSSKPSNRATSLEIRASLRTMNDSSDVENVINISSTMPEVRLPSSNIKNDLGVGKQ